MQGSHNYGAFCKKSSLHITIHLSTDVYPHDKLQYQPKQEQ